MIFNIIICLLFASGNGRRLQLVSLKGNNTSHSRSTQYWTKRINYQADVLISPRLLGDNTPGPGISGSTYIDVCGLLKVTTWHGSGSMEPALLIGLDRWESLSVMQGRN